MLVLITCVLRKNQLPLILAESMKQPEFSRKTCAIYISYFILFRTRRMSKRTLLTLIITHPTFEQERRALESNGQYPLVTNVLKQVEQDLVRDCVMKCVC